MYDNKIIFIARQDVPTWSERRLLATDTPYFRGDLLIKYSKWISRFECREIGGERDFYDHFEEIENYAKWHPESKMIIHFFNRIAK